MKLVGCQVSEKFNVTVVCISDVQDLPATGGYYTQNQATLLWNKYQ